MDKIQQLISFAERKIAEAETTKTDESVYYSSKRYWQGYIKGIQAAVRMLKGGEGDGTQV